MGAIVPMLTWAQASGGWRKDLINSQIIEAVGQLQKSDQTGAVETIRKQLERASCQLSLPSAGSVKMNTQELRQRAQESHLRVGWVYQCIKCDEWHVSLSGGYALTTNGAVATCYHVVNPPRNLRAGRLVAVDHKKKVFPVAEVLAANRYADACIVQVKGEGFLPLPLNTNISVGSTVHFLSEDQSERVAITAGVVNRFLQLPERRLENVRGAPPFVALRIEISIPFGPGSSGSAVLDEFGNAVGHASTITLADVTRPDSHELPPSQFIFHEVTSAKDILSLIHIGQ